MPLGPNEAADEDPGDEPQFGSIDLASLDEEQIARALRAPPAPADVLPLPAPPGLQPAPAAEVDRGAHRDATTRPAPAARRMTLGWLAAVFLAACAGYLIGRAESPAPAGSPVPTPSAEPGPPR